MITNKIAKLLFCLCFFFNNKVKAQIPFLENGYEKLDSVKGAVLYKKEVKGGKNEYQIYCQILDLRYVQLSNFIGKPDKTKETEGKYLVAKQSVKSPYFPTYLQNKALKEIRKTTNSKPIGMINGAFFEEFGDNTQMAFPIKNNGYILTSGSSPNGPCDNPKLPIFKKVQLKALVWTDSTVAIKDYDMQTGQPLTDNIFPNGVVTYSYEEHPVNLFRPLVADRFMVLGTFNSEESGNDNCLLILTVSKAGIHFAAAHLRQLGVKSAIIAIGGSGSVFMYNQNKGFVESPGMMISNGTMSTIQLPHFLFFTAK